MALNKEDKADVSRAFGKKAASAVSRATRDSKSKALKGKMGGKGSFIEELEAHKARGASFDNGTWKPAHKGQTFIQALEAHKADSAGRFR